MGAPHPQAFKALEESNLLQLMRNTSVRSASYVELVNTYDISRLRYLKLDMEGCEIPVLKEMISLCRDARRLCPLKIQFETRHMKKKNPASFRMHYDEVQEHYVCDTRGETIQHNDRSDVTCGLKEATPRA